MKRRTFVASVTATGMSLVSGADGFAQEAATPAPGGEATTQAGVESGYAPVNGLQMYYEIHGKGEPLVLIHGAFSTIEFWGPILTTLAQDHQVIAVELQAHGHTADIDRPFNYEAFADDVAALLEYLGVAQADVVGYSMGANTALRLAIQHPNRVRKLVAISGNSRTDGYYPELLEMIESLAPEMLAGSPPEQSYMRTAPNPEDWPVLFDKIKALEANTFDWTQEMGRIAAPTLLIIGDSDAMRPEHAAEMFRLLGGGVPGDLTGLPNSQLAIVPGATHVSLVDESFDLWLPMVQAFLAAPMPAAPDATPAA
jgi:pimeloyl-ACP methyl ester carboxylesterase